MKKYIAIIGMCLLLAACANAFERVKHNGATIVFDNNQNKELLLNLLNENNETLDCVSQVWFMNMKKSYNLYYYYFWGTHNIFYMYDVNNRIQNDIESLRSDINTFSSLVAQYNPYSLKRCYLEVNKK